MNAREAWLGGACGLCGIVIAVAASPPPPDVAVENWYRIRHAIDSGAVAGASTPPSSVHAVLRHHGRPVASAWSIQTPDIDDPVQAAAAELLAKAKVDSGLINLPDSLVEQGLRHATLEVETGGEFIPLTAPTLQAVADRLNPTVHGIALRTGTEWIVRFPSALRLTGAAATLATLHELAAVSGYTPSGLDAARQSGRATLYGFESIDLVQFSTSSPPRVFERGAAEPTRDVSHGAFLNRLTHVGSHLLTHTWRGEDGAINLSGTYLPMSNQYRPIQASDRDTALAVLAFDRLAAVPSLPELAQLASEARDALIPQLNTSDPVVAALQIVLSKPEAGLAETVSAVLSDQNESRMNRAISAWSLSHHPAFQSMLHAFLLEAATWSQTDVEAALPWLGWADTAHAESRGTDPILQSHWTQLSERFSTAITATQRPGPARLTSVLLRQAAYLPSIRTSSEEPSDAIETLDDAMFLLNALIVGDEEAALTPVPSNTTGGVRAAAWDEHMSIPSQAFAILLLHDIVNQLDSGAAPDTMEVRQ